MKRIGLICFTIALGIMICAAGCARKKAGIKIGYSVPSMSNQFWVRVAKGVQDEAKKGGVPVIVVDAQDDSGKQLSGIEDLIQKRVSVILISPWDTDTAASAIKKANKAGIPVIVVDIGTSGGKYESFIISNNQEGGRLAGRYVAGKLNNKGSYAHIQCQLGARNARLRGQGFEEIMKQKGLTKAAEQPADSKRNLGMSVMEDILVKHGGIDAVFAENDEMALGALQAIEAAAKKHSSRESKKIIVVGFDGNDDALKAIKDGRMAASVGQQPEEMGRIAVTTAIKIIKKDKVE